MRRIVAHPLTAILMIDVFLTLLIATLAYIGAQVILPGIGSQFILPPTLFIVIFACYIIILFVVSHTAHTYDVAPPHTPLRIVAIALLGICVGIANYFYGWIAGGIVTCACMACYYLFIRLYDNLLVD